MIPDLLSVSILTATCGCGSLLIAYKWLAIPRGLPVGELLSRDFSWLHGLAYIGIIGPVILSFFVSEWWTSIIVVAGANILVRILLSIFQAHAQVIATLGLLVGLIASGFLAWA